MAGSGGADVRAQSSGRSAPAHGLRLRTRRRGGSAGPGPHPARGPGAAVRGHRSHAPCPAGSSSASAWRPRSPRTPRCSSWTRRHPRDGRRAFMRVLDEAAAGRTIIAADHNPEPYLRRCNRVIILGAKGRVVFDGPGLPDNAAQLGVRAPGHRLTVPAPGSAPTTCPPVIARSGTRARAPAVRGRRRPHRAQRCREVDPAAISCAPARPAARRHLMAAPARLQPPPGAHGRRRALPQHRLHPREHGPGGQHRPQPAGTVRRSATAPGTRPRPGKGRDAPGPAG